MPLTITEFASSARHRLLGVGRVLQAHGRNHYIEEWGRRGVILHPVTEKSRHIVDCPFCGYALADFSVTPDWIVQTCSAFLLPDMISNPAFAKYFSRLSKSKDESVSLSGQGSGISRPVVVPAAPGSD
jgi:hypothetical protein